MEGYKQLTENRFVTVYLPSGQAINFDPRQKQEYEYFYNDRTVVVKQNGIAVLEFYGLAFKVDTHEANPSNIVIAKGPLPKRA